MCDEIESRTDSINDQFNKKLDILANLIYSFNTNKQNELEYIKRKKKDYYDKLINLSNMFQTQLEKRNKLRELYELLKIEKILGMIFDFNNENKSVVVFLNFNRSINLLLNLIENINIDLFNLTGVISKGNDAIMRNDYIFKFQRDEIHLMIVNMKSGGVGISLHDKNKQRPRASIISLSDNDFDINQAFGRIYRFGTQTDVEQYIILLETEIDIKVFNNFYRKSNNMKIINDGKY